MLSVKPKKFPSPLKKSFPGSSRCGHSFSQAWQDIFVLVALDGLVGGRYVEIGAGDARSINNTYLLEKEFNWSGVSLDIDDKAIKSYKRHRRNPCVLMDACEADFSELLRKYGLNSRVDYLQVDIEPSTNSLRALVNFFESGTRPRVVTFETDFYDPNQSFEISEKVRSDSRLFMQDLGYQLVAGDVGSTSAANPFEDWYVDPKQVEVRRLEVLMVKPERPIASEQILFTGPFLTATELYEGQGLGNQLWAYAVTRLAAQHQGLQFAVSGKSRFKGRAFIDLDFGDDLGKGIGNQGGPPLSLPSGITNYYSELRAVDTKSGLDVSVQDPNLWKLPPNTKIDGNFQSFEYLRGNESLVRSWISIDDELRNRVNVDVSACYVHVRGGDFKGLKNTSLGASYYQSAINYLRDTFGVTQFVAVTDDPKFAESVLPSYVRVLKPSGDHGRDKSQARHHIGHEISQDFISLSKAKFLIISNSSFSWWAAFLNTDCSQVVAPKFWAAHESGLGIWSTGGILTPGFTYLDAQGNQFSSEECQEELLRSRRQVELTYSGGTSELASLRQYLVGRLRFEWYRATFHLVTLCRFVMKDVWTR
jgi:hypothetical protein